MKYYGFEVLMAFGVSGVVWELARVGSVSFSAASLVVIPLLARLVFETVTRDAIKVEEALAEQDENIDALREDIIDLRGKLNVVSNHVSNGNERQNPFSTRGLSQ